MRKDESESAIRALCHQWKKERNLGPAELEHPSFSDFKAWAQASGYGQYFQFPSVMGADYDAEMWFDQEFSQMWRR